MIVLPLILLAIVGLSGCASPASTQQVVCTPESTRVNIYRVAPQSWANSIFEYAYPTIPTPIPPNTAIPVQLNEQQILGARYAAFQYLIKETKRWSAIVTIKLDDSSEAQIIVTFISPELLQAVFLSDILKDRFITSGFQAQIQNVLNAVAERDELLFLLTVTTTNNNINSTHHIIKIPIGKMILNNAENLEVEPKHDDHNLEQPINSAFESVFGYLAYPLAELSGSQCKWILDPKYNTNIVITVPSIELDGVSSSESHSWTIPYVSLISPISPPDLPNFIAPPGFDQNLMSPLPLPPKGINQTNNWQDFARFVWNQITLGNY